MTAFVVFYVAVADSLLQRTAADIVVVRLQHQRVFVLASAVASQPLLWCWVE